MSIVRASSWISTSIYTDREKERERRKESERERKRIRERERDRERERERRERERERQRERKRKLYLQFAPSNEHIFEFWNNIVDTKAKKSKNEIFLDCT